MSTFRRCEKMTIFVNKPPSAIASLSTLNLGDRGSHADGPRRWSLISHGPDSISGANAWTLRSPTVVFVVLSLPMAARVFCERFI